MAEKGAAEKRQGRCEASQAKKRQAERGKNIVVKCIAQTRRVVLAGLVAVYYRAMLPNTASPKWSQKEVCRRRKSISRARSSPISPEKPQILSGSTE